MKLVLDYFTKNCFNFRARASRREYWLFQLMFFLISLVVVLLEKLGFSIDIFAGVIGILILVPGISVTVRRLHDTGRSAWFLLLGLIPIVGSICMLILMCYKGNKEANTYGDSPLLLK
jgi:uncharacterized membrane protein YhaH (DUF805 family)